MSKVEMNIKSGPGIEVKYVSQKQMDRLLNNTSQNEGLQSLVDETNELASEAASALKAYSLKRDEATLQFVRASLRDMDNLRERLLDVLSENYFNK